MADLTRRSNTAIDHAHSGCCGYPHAIRGEEWDLASTSRVVNALGAVSRIGDLLAEHGARSVLIVTDSGLRGTGMVDHLEASITKQRLAVTVHSAIPANPSTASLDVAAQAARDCRADHIVAFGGGSALDAAKAVALLARTDLSAERLTGDEPIDDVLPIAAIPTTAGTGAETNGFGVMESSDHRKVYIGSDKTVPALVILDAELTTALPAAVTAASGFDAIIHGVESLLSRGATTLSRAFAAESLRLTTAAPVKAVKEPDLETRSRMMTGAHLAGRALTVSGLGLVHGIGHSITATTGTPHGSALAAIAGPALRFGIDAAPASYRELARALSLDVTGTDGADRAVQLIVGIASEIGLPGTAGEVGVSEELIDTIVTKTLDDAVTSNTPRHPSRDELTDLLATNLSTAGERAR
ncbi:MAG: iron-containing alcohol dehydrogenase [Pseudonocardiaceae bacterium]|nr:iron-containing alcohol dehydrogenase [Pseudonocardiaceae bacterium]